MPQQENYSVERVHMTALQKRLYPEAKDRPFVVREASSGNLVGLPDRYHTRSGAQARADRLNARVRS
jgi:hypothetical protein